MNIYVSKMGVTTTLKCCIGALLIGSFVSLYQDYINNKIYRAFKIPIEIKFKPYFVNTNHGQDYGYIILNGVFYGANPYDLTYNSYFVMLVLTDRNSYIMSSMSMSIDALDLQQIDTISYKDLNNALKLVISDLEIEYLASADEYDERITYHIESIMQIIRDNIEILDKIEYLQSKFITRKFAYK